MSLAASRGRRGRTRGARPSPAGCRAPRGPRRATRVTNALMHGLRPGTSPPPVRTARRMPPEPNPGASRRLRSQAAGVAELADARDSKSRVLRDVWVRPPPPASARATAPAPKAAIRRRSACSARGSAGEEADTVATGTPAGTPAPTHRSIRDEEEEVDCEEEVCSAAFGLLVAALALVAAGCGGERRGRGAGGAAVVVVHGDRVRGRRRSRLHHRVRPPAPGLVARRRPSRSQRRSGTCSSSASARPATTTIGYQSCDDATAQAGKWDSGKCSQNANATPRTTSVIGVIGTFNSGCAAIIIPVLNEAPDGGIPMISPANTWSA